ncbi:hypothetical protein JCM19038_2995 [Geomicrobium sp. JCM 19038]|nr:hypothetical protein JCM19038_2995 [Geomicrobium sp. JCM 19038]
MLLSAIDFGGVPILRSPLRFLEDDRKAFVFSVLSLLIPYIGIVFGIIAITYSNGKKTSAAIGGKILGILGVMMNTFLLLIITLYASTFFINVE